MFCTAHHNNNDTAMKFNAAPPISATAPLKDVATGRAEVFKLDPRHVVREPGWNPREDFGDMVAFCANLEANGVMEALTVRKVGEVIYLVNGDRRLTGVEKLMAEGRWPEDPKNPGFPMPVPCTSEGRNVKPLDRIFMMLSLNTGKPFTMLEKAAAYQKALTEESGITDAEIARRSGETKQAVSNALTLVRKGCPALIQFVRDGKLSATTALEIAKAQEDHNEQTAAAKAAIATAKEAGRGHATPKDLPAKAKKDPKPEAEMWDYKPSENFSWNAGSAEAPTAIELLGLPKHGITRLAILTSLHENGRWHSSFAFQTKTRGFLGAPCQDTASYLDENAAIIAAWKLLGPIVLDHTKTTPLAATAILTLATKASHALHARFPTGEDADDSAFQTTRPEPDASDDNAPFIADLSDENGSSDDPKSDAPDDPEAYQKLKNANTSNRDGSNSGAGGSGGSGFAAPDKRMKNIEEMLDSLSKDECHADRWDTMELVMDYLNGSHTVATLKKHLAIKATT
jgi:ParB-like chromosome segregation protein Spo0J